jgi:hypothetical protein
MFVGNGDDVVQAHRIVRMLKEIVITPAHAKRKESPEFRNAKKRLRQDGHYRCWICGDTKKLQVHHYGGEWSLEGDFAMDLLKQFLQEWDVYGYSHLLRNLPLTTVDDVRNMMVLCQKHHTGEGHGIHEITFPIWITQKICKSGITAVPE